MAGTNYPNGIKTAGIAVTASAAELNKLHSLAGTLSGSRFAVTYPQVNAADTAKTFFIAPAACKVISAYERHVTVSNGACALTIEKCTTGEAPAAGDDLFATPFDLTSTANTPVLSTAVTTAAGTLAAGDALGLKVASGTNTGYVLGTISVLMEWI